MHRQRSLGSRDHRRRGWIDRRHVSARAKQRRSGPVQSIHDDWTSAQLRDRESDIIVDSCRRCGRAWIGFTRRGNNASDCRATLRCVSRSAPQLFPRCRSPAWRVGERSPDSSFQVELPIQFEQSSRARRSKWIDRGIEVFARARAVRGARLVVREARAIQQMVGRGSLREREASRDRFGRVQAAVQIPFDVPHSRRVDGRCARCAAREHGCDERDGEIRAPVGAGNARTSLT